MNQNLTLKNIDYLKIEDSSLYGCDQLWYAKPWQRLSGCGPTCATMMVLYQTDLKKAPKTKEEAISVMNVIWKYVTPGFGGINRLDRFYTGLSKYFTSLNLPYTKHNLEVSKLVEHRPSLSEVSKFIQSGLREDAPIAFLNLNNGKVHNLEAYHWVLIVGIDVEGTDHVLVHILDGGERLIIDLALWLETTTSSGGFIYYTFVSP